MCFGSLARLSAVAIVAAFAVGCAQEDVAGTKVRTLGSAAAKDDDGSGASSASSTTTTNDDGVAKPVTPATPPASTTPTTQVKPAQKPAILCNTDVDSVTQSYATALQRKPDEGGLQTWLGVIQNGETRLGVLKQLLKSTEFATSRENLTNAELVTELYRTFFDREPDPVGFQGWLNALDGGAARSNVAIEFVSSPEFMDPNSNRAAACYF